MYLLLLGFGVVLSAAGILLAAAGLSVREGSFDAGLVTPGIVSAVGGFLLIGLGLALRTLQRIEQALAARATPRIAQGEIAGTTELPGHVGGPGLFPLPSQTSPAPQPPAPAVRTGDDQPANTGAEKSSEAARVGNRLLPPFPKIAVSAGNEATAEADALHSGKRGNGVAAARAALRLPIGERPTAPPERPKAPAFDILWPKGQRPTRVAQPAPAQAAPVPPKEPQHDMPQPRETAVQAPAQDAAGQSTDAQAEATQAEATQAEATQTVVTQVATDDSAAKPVSVLKSGVVDGMAYTLYSDGSIEAQLPQGTLRFGSITELRHHLEQSA